jgi:hypothetical protein
MTFNSHAAYAARRISSKLNGSTKQFGWLQAPAIKLIDSQWLAELPRQAILVFGKDLGKK